MAVKLIEIKKFETTTATANKYVIAHLFASSKDAVGSDMVVDGLPETYILSAGSYVRTAAGDIGQLDFDGTWKFVGEEEEEGTRSVSLQRNLSPIKLSEISERSDDAGEDPGEDPVRSEDEAAMR